MNESIKKEAAGVGFAAVASVTAREWFEGGGGLGGVGGGETAGRRSSFLLLLVWGLQFQHAGLVG